MKALRDNIKVGDPVEVRFIDLKVGEIWVRGAVRSVAKRTLGIAFGNGTYGSIERPSKQWRPV